MRQMNNPFDLIEKRLQSIEGLILDLKHKPDNHNTREVKDMLSIQETAELLHLSVSTIYGKVSRREIPFMKRGKRLYFSKSELLEYLKEGRRKTISEIEKDSISQLRNKQ